MRMGLLALCVLACLAAAPEPSGYWTGPALGAVPDTIAGGAVIHTGGLAGLLRRGRVVLIDVSGAPRRPAGLAAGAMWLPLPHRDIPGSVWIPDAGLGVAPTAVSALFARRLGELTGGDRGRAVVVYCHPSCWLSWNAAKRAIAAGYREVYWYPDGIEGWITAGQPGAVAAPERPAGGAAD